MQIHVQVGDVLAAAADALISTANPWLNLSGGVNGATLAATGPATQEELHGYLRSQGISAVPAGTVVQSSSGNLPFDCMRLRSTLSTIRPLKRTFLPSQQQLRWTFTTHGDCRFEVPLPQFEP
ncbi:macro domain-containing protein [Rhodopirellula baltica]|uniref:Macro domain-containing protein n=1 Tax=Rhodopirellula baltica SWK14 TaxID=993516 RepID=L7C903_RHOBT|nr:hypothetical protein [Rhodopirellula baltica]ELP30137.1 hypothetical protein RBSWK_05895 [Rhodopirellula baltica SWK14]